MESTKKIEFLKFSITVLSLIITAIFADSLIAQSNKSKPKVVLISVDGAADWMIDDLLERNVLPPDGAFALMRDKGLVADKMIPVNVAATAVSHTSLFTGATPGKTGVVGNNFLKPENVIKGLRATSGFNTEIEAETLWNAVKRQGAKVITLNSVGTNITNEGTRGTNTIDYGVKLANSSVVSFDISSQEEELLSIQGIKHLIRVNLSNKISFKLLRSKEEIPLFAYVVNHQINNSLDFNGVILDFDSDISNGYAGVLKKGEWSPISFKVKGQDVVSWCYLKELNSAGQGEIYIGAIGYNPGYPEKFKSFLQSEVGLWPCEQDNRKLSQGLITEKMWFDQAERLAEYYKDLILANIKNGDWDLLIGYMNLVDDVQHRYLLKHPRQLEYNLDNGERRRIYDRYVEWAYKKIDKFLLYIIKNMDDDVNLIIMSDHGMAPTHSIFLINNFLNSLGYNVQGNNCEVRAYTTGPAGHIYINLENRNLEGKVSYDEFEKMKKTILSKLKDKRDPETNEPIFNVVLERDDMKGYGVFHPKNSGDIFVSANVGWSLSSKIEPEIGFIIPNAFKKDATQNLDTEIRDFLSRGFMNETGLGVHGHLGNEREMHAIFYGIGPHLPNKKIGSIEAINVAATITDLLQLNAPKDSEGLSLLKN